MQLNIDGFWGAVPIAVLRDKRLKGNDIRVYAALSSFQGGNKKSWPSRRLIAERSGVHFSHISKHTKRLKDLGYLVKIQRGKKISNIYRLSWECAVTALGEDALLAPSTLKEQLREQQEGTPSSWIAPLDFQPYLK